MREKRASCFSTSAIQCTSFSASKKNFRPTIARKAPPKPAMPTWAPDTIRSYCAGCSSERRIVSIGPSPAAIATMASGKTIRIPNTAMTMPQVRNRFCQIGSMSLSTAALTTALSNDSEISSTERTSTIHSSSSVLAREPVSCHPYHAPSTSAARVNSSEPANWRSISGTSPAEACDTCDSVQRQKNASVPKVRGMARFSRS